MQRGCRKAPPLNPEFRTYLPLISTKTRSLGLAYPCSRAYRSMMASSPWSSVLESSAFSVSWLLSWLWTLSSSLLFGSDRDLIVYQADEQVSAQCQKSSHQQPPREQPMTLVHNRDAPLPFKLRGLVRIRRTALRMVNYILFSTAFATAFFRFFGFFSAFFCLRFSRRLCMARVSRR